MLYTVIPLERIYNNMTKSIIDEYMAQGLLPLDTSSDFKDISIDNGRISAKRQGDKYIVNRINSTNMSDYLDDKYTPGKEIDI